MRTLLGGLASVLLVVGLASAADERRAQPTQNQRMTECNAQAREKHLAGDARKQFMSGCLKANPEDRLKVERGSQPAKSTEGERHTTRGERMKACNQEASAKDLHGDDRRHFMSECLKTEKKS